MCRSVSKKDTELRRIIDSKHIPCEDKTRNAVMRTAIWQHFSENLQLSTVDIDVTKGDTKSIWEKLQKYLPLYSLFQADRKNSDGDGEAGWTSRVQPASLFSYFQGAKCSP